MIIKIKVCENEKYLLAVKYDKNIEIYSQDSRKSCESLLRDFFIMFNYKVSYVMMADWKLSSLNSIIKSFLEVR